MKKRGAISVFEVNLDEKWVGGMTSDEVILSLRKQGFRVEVVRKDLTARPRN